MSATEERFPRPGHAGDLHEWAKQHEAEAQETITSALELAVEGLKDLFTEKFGAENMTEELARELDMRIDNIRRLAALQARHEYGPRLTDIYSGEAFNA